MIKRKSFQNRFDAGKAVHGNELIYPYLQGYDSVELNADIEIGGSDQLFNMMFGRDLQQKYGQEPQVVMTTPLLEGLDGNLKMSKSLGNTVGVEENPNDMYMKIMKVNDELVDKYFSLLTNLNHMQVNSIKNSYRNLDTYEIDLKKKLAYEITSMLHNSSEARDAQENFEKVVQNKDLPTNIEDLCMDLDRKITPLEILQGTNAYSSNSNIRRLIQQRGFSIDGQIVDDPFIEMKLEPGAIIKAGKKNIYKLSY
ncbi:tyrosine--tRNA ligase [Candidatus Woesearchaeota archaeon]|nr:MAG: tyrosine--tRNA ligase [Candidatus Woesearchaeota archaeon]